MLLLSIISLGAAFSFLITYILWIKERFDKEVFATVAGFTLVGWIACYLVQGGVGSIVYGSAVGLFSIASVATAD